MATYGQIAALLGQPRNARVVGWAMHSAPVELELPWHRVVNKAGSMCPAAFCHPEAQRRLLESEGITFKADGCIDLEKHLWEPEGVYTGD